MITAIIAVICTLAISVPVTFYATSNYRKKQQEGFAEHPFRCRGLLFPGDFDL